MRSMLNAPVPSLAHTPIHPYAQFSLSRREQGRDRCDIYCAARSLYASRKDCNHRGHHVIRQRIHFISPDVCSTQSPPKASAPHLSHFARAPIADRLDRFPALWNHIAATCVSRKKKSWLQDRFLSVVVPRTVEYNCFTRPLPSLTLQGIPSCRGTPTIARSTAILSLPPPLVYSA